MASRVSVGCFLHLVIQVSDDLQVQCETYRPTLLLYNTVAGRTAKRLRPTRIRVLGMGLFDVFSKKKNKSTNDFLFEGIHLSNFLFESNSHIRVQSGYRFGLKKLKRIIKIENNINGDVGKYTLTIYNGEEINSLPGISIANPAMFMARNGEKVNSLSGSNVQLSPKPMEVVRREKKEVELRGYGYDRNAVLMGVPKEQASFEDYGITIFHSEDGTVKKCVVHWFDRNVDIEYYPTSNGPDEQNEDCALSKTGVLHLDQINYGNYIEEHAVADLFSKLDGYYFSLSNQNVLVIKRRESVVLISQCSIMEKDQMGVVYKCSYPICGEFRLVCMSDWMRILGNSEIVTFGSMQKDGFAVTFKLQ